MADSPDGTAYANGRSPVSETMYRELAESITDGFYELNHDWCFTYVNHLAASNVGYTPAGLVGKNIWETFPRILGTPHERYYRQVMEQRKPASYEMAGVLTSQWYELRIYPSVNGITVFWTDITERKQKEDALRSSEASLRSSEASLRSNKASLRSNEASLRSNEASLRSSEARLRNSEAQLRESEQLARERLAEIEAIYRNAPIGLCVFDSELRWVRLNQRIAEINGVALEDHIGRTPREVVPDVGEQAEEALRKILETGKPLLEFEMRGTTAAQPGVERFWNERWAPIKDNDGSVIGISVAAEEITERKRADMALAASEAKYRALAESICDPVAAFDANMRLVYRNEAAEKSSKIPNSEAIGKTFEEVYPDLVGSELHQAYCQALETGRPQTYLNHWTNPTDGLVSWYEINLYPNRDGLVAFSREVTERIRAQEAFQAEHARAAWLAHLPDENPDAVARVSLDGRILYYNKAAADPDGWNCTTDQPLPESLRLFYQQVVAAGVKAEQDIKIGERVYSVTIVPSPDDQCANLYGKDITERVRVKNELFNERNRLLAVMESLPVGLAIYDANGGIIQANPGFEAVWGSPRPHAKSVNDYDLYKAWWVENGEPVQPEEWAAARAVQHGETNAGQFIQIQKFDGSTGYMLNSGAPVRDAQGKVIGAVVAIMDITKSIQTEKALQDSQVRFRVALASVPMLVYSCDRDLRYTWVYNPRHGFQLEDVLGKRDDEILPPEAAVEMIAAKQQALDSGQGSVQEIKVPLDGKISYYILTTEPLKDAHGRITGLTCSAIDITEQRRLELEEAEFKMQMEMHSRLMENREKERQEIARDLHDGPIQTLVSTIFNIQFTKEALPDPQLRIELDQIGLSLKAAVRELRDVVNELRPPSLIRFGLVRSIQVHSEDYREKHPELEVILELADDQGKLAEPTCLALFRIYQEAMNNVYRHSGASRVSVRFTIDTDHTCLTIQDNGQGISGRPDMVALTERGHYGLAGMKERAEAAGGTLRVSAPPGQGTTIEVQLPMRRR